MFVRAAAMYRRSCRIFGFTAALTLLAASGRPQCELLDSAQELSTFGTSWNNQWQSFTINVSGALSQVQIRSNGASGLVTFTMTIRAGEGTGGAVLYSGVHSYDQNVMVNAFQPVLIPSGSRPAVAAGNQYTMEFTNVTGNISGMLRQGDPYPGGRFSSGPADDGRFRVFVTSACATPTPSATPAVTPTPTPTADCNMNGMDDTHELSPETIVLRSGNGPVPGTDTRIHMLVNPPLGVVLTPAHYAAARSGPPAFIIQNHPAWIPDISGPPANDPLARWISTHADGATAGEWALYAIDFQIDRPTVGSAMLSFFHSVDNVVGNPPNPSVSFNGFDPACSVAGGIYTNQSSAFCTIPGSQLQPGLNTFYVVAGNFGGPAGLIFSASLTVFPQDTGVIGLPDDCEPSPTPTPSPDPTATPTLTPTPSPSPCLPAPDCIFPVILSENTTGAADSVFTGAPDDMFFGLGNAIVTYALPACGTVADLAGPDFNVYEVDTGGAEFNLVDVLVSSDGMSFTSVSSSAGPVVRIPGDSTHSIDSFARSFDLQPSGLTGIRYIRLAGLSANAPGTAEGFDLDGIGIIHPATLSDCNSNSVSDGCDIASGFSLDLNLNGVPDECDPAATPSPTPAATPTSPPTATPSPVPCCPGDANNSGSFVDANDFIAVQANFGADNGVGGLGDANCSGSFVDANDFIAVQANFGSDCG